MSELANDERAPFDAYWTPDQCARACVEAIAYVLPRAVWPSAIVDAWDIQGGDGVEKRDYLAPPVIQPSYDVVLGNPPYAADHFLEWLDRPQRHAGVVAWLLRSTALGSQSRYHWWQRNKPTHIWTLTPRPRWGGPGSRSATDPMDSVLVLWQPSAARRLVDAGARVHTRHDQLRWKDPPAHMIRAGK